MGRQPAKQALLGHAEIDALAVGRMSSVALDPARPGGEPVCCIIKFLYFPSPAVAGNSRLGGCPARSRFQSAGIPFAIMS